MPKLRDQNSSHWAQCAVEPLSKQNVLSDKIYCMISPSLPGAMEDCSIVQSSSCKCSVAEGAVCLRHNACSARCGT